MPNPKLSDNQSLLIKPNVDRFACYIIPTGQLESSAMRPRDKNIKQILTDCIHQVQRADLKTGAYTKQWDGEPSRLFQSERRLSLPQPRSRSPRFARRLPELGADFP